MEAPRTRYEARQGAYSDEGTARWLSDIELSRGDPSCGARAQGVMAAQN
jgi:hypothetical protein